MKLDINGIIAAGFSPFNTNGELNLTTIPKLVNSLIDQGIKGFYINGSTGEGMSCTIAERFAIAEAYLEAVNGQVPVIVGVSHSSYKVSAQLTQHAVSNGAYAVSATPPSYYSISSIQQLVYAVENMANCQDSIPFIYYHIPGKTGLGFKMMDFLDAIDGKLPQLKGIKYTSNNLDDYQRCCAEFGDRYKMFFGLDELYLPALSIGADTFIGSTYNFLLPNFQKLHKYFNNNDYENARKEYNTIVLYIQGFLKYDGLAAQKAIMKMVGHDFGPTKSPVLPLSTSEYQQLEKFLLNNGFFNSVKDPIKNKA